MVDPKVLERAGYTPEKLRAKFAEGGRSQKVQNLLDLQATRVYEAFNRTIRDARVYWTIDRAYDVAQRQISPTFLEGLRSQNLEPSKVESIVTSLGLSSMLTARKDPITDKPTITPDGKPTMELNLPTFWQVYVPLVMSYHASMWANLFGRRYQHPLYKYTPQMPSPRERAACEIVTHRVQRMTDEMGYVWNERQAIGQMLLYGHCLNIPREPWYQCRQQRINDEDELEEYVEKEGVRFFSPHPARSFIDYSHSAQSLNYDTGVQFFGFWDVYRWADVVNNKDYWLPEQAEVEVNGNALAWLDTASWNVYRNLFPCTIDVPDTVWNSNTVSEVDRIQEAFRYTQSVPDQGVTVVTSYVKLVPKDWDLFDYPFPIWFRFVQALETSVLLVEPVCYSPGVIYQYRADQNRYRNPSLVQELMPFQDHLGNVLSQYLLSIKRNLKNVTFYDKNALPPETVAVIKNLGNTAYEDFNLLGVDTKEVNWQTGKDSIRDLFENVTFPQVNSAEHVGAINLIINVMERVVGFSSVEVGGAASHQQSATEVTVINSYVEKRAELLSSFIDDAWVAKKKLLYDAFMAYGDDTVFAQVAELTGAKKAMLEDMGFKVEESGDTNRTAGVIGPKSKLVISSFASSREGVNRQNDQQIGQAMLQVFQSIFSNQALLQAVGVETPVRWFNRVLTYLGLDKELQLPLPGDGQAPDELTQKIASVVQAITGEQMAQLGDGLKKGVIDPLMASQEQTNQAVGQVAERVGLIEQALTAPMMA